MTTIIRVLVLAALVAYPGLASAQDANLQAVSGTYSLQAGFTPDPYQLSVTAGGSIDAYDDTNLPGECVGNISNAPDIELTYTAGSLPLVFRTRSSADTTLIINGPNNQWYCDDDGWGDGDAEVRFNKPQSGTYDIWIGSFNGGMASTTLLITETP